MEKEPTIENKINIFEFKKWLNNFVNDAEARGLNKDDIVLSFLEKSQEIFVKRLAKMEEKQIKNLAERKEMNIFEFKRWLDNCVIDAEARGLNKDNIVSALVEKSQEILKRLQKSEKE